jgi:hypothetical protein
MSLILNFLTEISIREGNSQTLPQIRIDDGEATRCLNVTATICPNYLRLINRGKDHFCIKHFFSHTRLHYYFNTT